MKLGLISCGSKKTDEPAPARDLYTGPYFRAALAAALAECDDVRIVSAKYGLVALDQVLEPYNLRITWLSKLEVLRWRKQVQASLLELGYTECVLFLPKDYRDAVGYVPRSKLHPAMNEPGLGYQLQAFKRIAKGVKREHVSS